MRVIDLSAGQNLVDLCMQETGGLGVNCIIDSGGIIILLQYSQEQQLLQANYNNIRTERT